MTTALEGSSLRNVPLEVLLRITEELTTPDLGAFRLTCRAIHDFLDNSFIAEFFTRKQFMITVFSLNALIDISRSRLGPRLRFLHIGLDRATTTRQELWAATPEQVSSCAAHIAEENAARAVGYHRDLLVEALKGLPNLESILLRDYNSRRRRRDGWNTEWKSYGNETIRTLTGVRPRFPHVYSRDEVSVSEASNVFTQLIYSCAQAGALPTAIEVITHRNHLDATAFSISAFNIQDSLVSVVEGLQKFHLSLSPIPRKSRYGAGRTVDGTNNEGLVYDFLKRAKNLTDLRINQTVDELPMGENPAHYLLEWLAAAAAKEDSNVTDEILPKLQNLSIGRFPCEPDPLIRVIQAFGPRLQSLELWRMELYGVMTWEQSREPTWPKISYWPLFLRDLRNSDLAIRHIKVGLMNQNMMKPADPSMGSHASLGPTCRVNLALEHTGSDWRQYLEEMEKFLKVTWESQYERPQEDHSNSDNSSGESDNSDEDSEMGDDAT